ncbi:Putative Pyruvate decarboxylase PdcA [Rhizopus microsporus]|uniref:Pyruvate decarboxylase PdcB n=2 Tax=Rhizopus microsporus TaxID=58291 RepID=A0A2G4SKP0_RHIZD|nr:pyruvate decarboxylase PdcB [Rhizopus microsporus ATCC 52813]ORE09503.1 pyruvate decarboxylase PdcB [Rhizopus microsporus var. microsporus]PHZ09348.1 pyruvate decarboxylase PdcB [Rhizopus microsporus ATCC 52813]CEG82915.1 Putative Pyruvate decarboxylase PdcA [Rhizopus microsporus]
MPSIKIGQHLLNRLKEINIDVVFGVPGDFNMPLLDLIEDDPELTWGNNANELNASYAADGYARIRGAGALITTFGVGELSAVNGVAGSYAEMLPVIHIVGTPSTKSQAAGAMLHHSLGDGNFDVFFNMSSMIACASAHLKKQTAIAEIDRVISQALLSKRTGYIGIPIDLIFCEVEIPDSLPPVQTQLPKNPPQVQEIALRVVSDAISKAKFPVIIVDGCVLRHRCQKQVQEFIERSGFPTYVAPMGKGAVDERLHCFRGCYSGNVTLEAVGEEIKQADLIIEIGSIKSDFNTGNFSYALDRSKTITLHSFATIVFCAEYQKVSMMEFIPLLTQTLPEQPRVFDLGPRHKPLPIQPGTEITHNYFWQKVPEYMDENAIVCAETGTAEFASLNMDGPVGTTYITQILWGSIGFSVGAAVGAAIADRNRRVYLFVGDGSFQLTCQEVCVFLRHGLTPVIFLLNNDGYLIEKLIHGPHRAYNNFQMWEYSKTLDYFGAHLEKNSKMGCPKVGFEGKVATRDEFEEAMKQVQANPDKIHFLEVIMPQFDAPRELELLVANSENR